MRQLQKQTQKIKNFQECENEINVCEKIKSIPFFFLYFNPIINHKLLSISEVDEHALENSESQNNNYVLILKQALTYPSFNIFFKNIKSTREKIVHLFDTYVYLLKAINELNQNEIVYFNITPDKIGFNKKNHPLLNNFSEGFTYNRGNLSTLNKRFTKYEPTIYSLPLEFHIISFLKDAGRESKSISQSNIEDICKDFIVKNYALLGFSQEFIKNFYKVCVSQVLSFEIINQPSEKIIKEMLAYSISWDNYSLSSLFLPIVSKIQNQISGSNEFLDSFSQLLLLNMDPDPKKRLSPLETIKKFQALFNNSIDWISIANITIDF